MRKWLRVKAKTAVASVLLAIVVLVSSVPFGSAQDTAQSYYLIDQENGNSVYTLNLVIPKSLTDYYQSVSHQYSSDLDLPKFVTPYAFKQVADALRQIYPNNEDFANGVLTLVHQIPYEETSPEFYPVETLLRNSGDCDMFSLVAASILMAADFQVVLLHYSNQEHMNIGIHLDSAPKDARFDVYSFTTDDLTYYIAECTSTNWRAGWRVGECPDDLKTAKAQIVTLENAAQVSPGQVSASFTKLEPTSITLTVSPLFGLAGSTVTVTGHIIPSVPNQNVTIYQGSDDASWTIISTVLSGANGDFSYSWASQDMGKLDIRAGWNGNEKYAGTTSQSQMALILPMYFVALVALAVTAVAVCVGAYAVSSRRRKAKRLLAAQPKPAPSGSSV